MATTRTKKTVDTVLQPMAMVPFTSVTVAGPLTDIGLHTDMFVGQSSGRYVINFVSERSTQSLSVLWDGTGLSL
jgi:hypothetical protein